jgi:biopolymer transport protein ExbB/TolQ
MNHGVPMIESFKNVMVRSGAGWVLYLLIALSVVSIAIAIDRAYAFWSRRDDVPRLMRELHRLLETEDLKKALALLEASSSVEASVVAAGLALWSHGSASWERSATTRRSSGCSGPSSASSVRSRQWATEPARRRPEPSPPSWS